MIGRGQSTLAMPLLSVVVVTVLLVAAGVTQAAGVAPAPPRTASSRTASSAFTVDAHTRLLAHLDGRLPADFASGSAMVTGFALPVSDGRFAGAVTLREGMKLSFTGNDGDIAAAQGTLEFWIRPHWDGNDGKVRSIFGAGANKGNYFNINKLATNRFGAAFGYTAAGKEIVYRRVDSDVAASWRSGSWHHVAVCWDKNGTLSLWLDGVKTAERTGAHFPDSLPAELTFIGSDYDLDELRISDVVRYGAAPAPSPSAGVVYLSDLTPTKFDGYAKLGRDCRYTVEGVSQPLAVGGFLYARGLGMHAPSTATYEIGDKFARLTATLGLSDFAGDGAAVVFVVKGDGRELFHSPEMTSAAKPLPLDLDIHGVETLVLQVEPGPAGLSGAHGNWVDAALLEPGRTAPESSRGAPSGRRDEGTAKAHFVEPPGVYRFSFPVDGGRTGIRLLPKNYLDDFDPQIAPTLPAAPEIRLSATPGETEPVTFVVLATTKQPAVHVSVSDLAGPNGAAIPAAAVTVRRVVRYAMRRLYTSKPDDTAIVGRFLPRWEPLDIPAGEFREVWLSLQLPDKLPAGQYHGTVTVKSDAAEVACPIDVTVYPFTLDPSTDKQLGSYYGMQGKLADPDLLCRELRDLKDHGAVNLVTDLSIQYVPDGDSYKPDYTALRTGLGFIRDAGIRGTIICGTGLATLARLRGHQGQGAAVAEEIDEDAEFQRIAKAAMEGFLQVERDFPELHLAVTHLDEVFNNNRLPLYIALSKAVRQVPQIKLYITFNTVNDAADAMRREIDPYVDIRCHHGYTFEWWLARGHTIDEYKAELRKSGDVAWLYHNARGVHFTPKWARIINGFYLWASPFSVHVPWTYQAFSGNPFDDTDGRGHDFGMSFPGIHDRLDLIPTRLWEAMREGGDDLRYIATLERLIRERRAAHPAAAAAQNTLDQLRRLITDVKVATVPAATPSAAPAAQTGKKPEIDLDTGLVMGTGTVGSAAESPLINALAKRFTGDQWQEIRDRIAKHIIALQTP